MASDGVGARGILEKLGGDAEGGRGKTDGGGANKGGDIDVVGDTEGGNDDGDGAGGEAEGVF